jgi:hypothetical protein
MSEVRLVVREAERDWSGTIHGSCADQAIAALSADPVTLDELEAAVTRFAKRAPQFRFFSNLSPGLCDEHYDAGLVVIDLVARLIMVDSTYSSPGLDGSVHYHDGHRSTDMDLRYHLAGDWLISTERETWRAVADKRRRERAANPLRDARAVFYGRPLLEFIARESFAAFQADVGRPSDDQTIPKTGSDEERCDSPFQGAIRKIHAAWLLTPREDLGGHCPREIAIDRRHHIEWDIQDRCEQWSLTGKCPPGLAKSSHAFRYGGFGTHELVKYYDLVRELLWSCWQQLADPAQRLKVEQRTASLTVGDFLANEVPRLEKVRDAWLDAPDPECHGRTPRSVIELERSRLPMVMSRQEAVHDPDCPCCQMAADMPGPMFWHLDGSAMDDDFAFDTRHRTRAEWEEEQRRWEEHSRRFNAEYAERERLGLSGSLSCAPDPENVWSRSFIVADTANVPVGIRVFGIGCHLAELIVGLRAGAERETTPREAQQHIDQLNRHFGNLRELLNSNDISLAASLIDPVLDRFAESLAMVAMARPDLALQCDVLTSAVKQLLELPPPVPDGDSGDTDIPF